MDENNLSNQLNIAQGPLRRRFVGKIKHIGKGMESFS